MPRYPVYGLLLAFFDRGFPTPRFSSSATHPRCVAIIPLLWLLPPDHESFDFSEYPTVPRARFL